MLSTLYLPRLTITRRKMAIATKPYSDGRPICYNGGGFVAESGGPVPLKGSDSSYPHFHMYAGCHLSFLRELRFACSLPVFA